MYPNTARIIRKAFVAALAASLILAALAVQGCGDSQAKQDFADEVLSIMEDNQSQPEIAEEGQEAFQAYYQSGFTDLESAQRASDSFTRSNQKDEDSLNRLDGMEKPDDAARDIVQKLSLGITVMDEGNSMNAEELDKAADQSVEERSQIFAMTAEAMGKYLEGIELIITAFEGLLDYVRENELQGEQTVETWLERFQGERESIEQALEAMSGV